MAQDHTPRTSATVRHSGFSLGRSRAHEPLLRQERKQLAHQGLVRPRAVLADLERLGVAHGLRPARARTTSRAPPGPRRRLAGAGVSQATSAAPPRPSAPTSRFPATHGSHSYICDTCASSMSIFFSITSSIDDRDVRPERIRPLEAVLEVHEDGVLAQAPACPARCSGRPPCRRRPGRGRRCSGGRGDSRWAAARARGRRSTGESAG